jgi:restriction system protein
MGYILVVNTDLVLGVVLGALGVVLFRIALRAYASRKRGPFPEESFRRFRGLIVPDERGTTEVDEIFVTPAGVFVVEMKDYGAWIYGTESEATWTAVYPNEKHTFQNPIRQNYRHIKALESFLQIPFSALTSVVAFSPRARMMSPMPPQVISSDHIAYVRSRKGFALSPDAFDRVCSRLGTLKAKSDAASFDRHVEHLKDRFNNPFRCPNCGGDLVQRQSRKPGNDGNVFLGCTNFPRCRFIRNLEAS